MRRSVLADTGPLYAAADPDDAHHQRAHRELRRITRDKREVIVAYPTLAEAYTLVLYRLGKQPALSWLDDVRSGVALVNPTPEDYQEAMKKVLAFPDQPITLFDATLAVLCGRLGVEVWTYDHHFDLMRAAIWR
ncbi:MAG TPA: PIN domain-containing protein [Terriglobales bacterium]|nr:PIN domain-containing protein [Terriglobales bacterium]